MTARDRRFAGTVNETISSSARSRKPNAERGAGRLGGVAAAPVLAGEPPADLDAGREMGLESRHGQADEADEIGHARHLDRPEPEAVAGEVVADPGDGRVALRAIHRPGEVLHHDRVRVHRGERREILVAPAAKAKARRLECLGKRHRGLPSSDVGAQPVTTSFRHGTRFMPDF